MTRHDPFSIFTVTYYDRDWETVEDLLMEDATYVDVLAAVASWLNFQHALRSGTLVGNHPLRDVEGLIIGGPDGEEA